MQYNYSSYNKKSKGLTIINNWKKIQIKNIVTLQEEMIKNNIDENDINKFIEEEYKIINDEYNLKIEKYNKKQKKYNINSKKKEIDNLILYNNIFNKYSKNIDKNIWQEYINKQYNIINNKYNDFIEIYSSYNISPISKSNSKNKQTFYNINFLD